MKTYKEICKTYIADKKNAWLKYRYGSHDRILHVLSCLTKKQNNMFNQMYPKGLHKLDDDCLCFVSDQCERTLEKNERFAQNLEKYNQ